MCLSLLIPLYGCDFGHSLYRFDEIRSGQEHKLVNDEIPPTFPKEHGPYWPHLLELLGRC